MSEKATKGPGRPIKKGGKHEMMTMRASVDEKALFEKAAAKDQRPLAQWMRIRLVAAAEAELKAR